MEQLNLIVRRGGKSTVLDKLYINAVNSFLDSGDEDVHIRWGIYNLIIKEFLDIDSGKYFDEFRYRVTDGENVNKIILDIFCKCDVEKLSGLIWFLKKRVEEFMDEDLYKRFY